MSYNGVLPFWKNIITRTASALFVMTVLKHVKEIKYNISLN